MPKVSVIIPNFNNGRYIEEAIKSVQNQSLKDIEIIIIDDCSTDDSWNILQQIAKSDSRIKIIQNQKNSGAGPSRNAGLDIATGEFIKFLDSDDTMDLDVLEIMYNTAQETKKDIVCGYMQHVNSDGTIRKYDPFFYKKSSMFNGKTIAPDDTPDLTPFNIVGIGDALYSRNLFVNIKFPSLKWEDFATIPIIKHSAGEMAYIDKAVYNYKVHENNTTATDLRKKTPRIADIVKCCDILREKMPIQHKERTDYLELNHVLSRVLDVAAWNDCSRREKEKIISALYRIVEIDIPQPTQNKFMLRHAPLLNRINMALSTIQKENFSIEDVLRQIHNFKNEPINLNAEINNYNSLMDIYNNIEEHCKLLYKNKTSSSKEKAEFVYQSGEKEVQCTKEQLEDKLIEEGLDFYRKLQISQTYSEEQKDFILNLFCTAFTYLIPQIDRYLIVPRYRKIQTYLRPEYESMTKEECMKSIDKVVHSKEFQQYQMSRMAIHCIENVTTPLLLAYQKFKNVVSRFRIGGENGR